MPRCARVKDPNGIYHIMIRSISEILLFKSSNDKTTYLQLLKKYQKIFSFKVYGYCFMNNHGHFMIYSNGADISKFMHGINQSYARYYNKKYERHGHVFADRFKSKLISDESYLLTASAYIHNNPKDIMKYKDCVENYKFSSLAIYIGKMQDKYGILDISYILERFSSNFSKAKMKYLEFVKSRTNSEVDCQTLSNLSFSNEPTEYKSQRKCLIRNINYENILDFVSTYLNQDKNNIHIKYNHNSVNFRAICAFLMRCLSNFNYKDIASILGNLTTSSISRLTTKGYELTQNNPKFKNIIDDFLLEYALI